jgi:hypothetical protein
MLVPARAVMGVGHSGDSENRHRERRTDTHGEDAQAERRIALASVSPGCSH